MAAKHLFALCVTTAALAGLTVACNATARHRVLTFFFDGVPEPGKANADSKNDHGDAEPEAPEGTAVADSHRPTFVAKKLYTHPPYRDAQCRRCHQPAGVKLVATPQEGLCARCHPNIPGDAPFVHGPVAVRDCLFCHHHHESTIPHILRRPPDETCLRCHDRTDLTTGPHHAEIGDRQCIECHNPHAGAVRFFLKRDEP